MKSAPPRVDQRIGAPLTLPLPPAANSTSSGLPCTSGADQVPYRAGLADALAAKSASAKAKKMVLIGVLPFAHTKWRGRFMEQSLRGLTPCSAPEVVAQADDAYAAVLAEGQ